MDAHRFDDLTRQLATRRSRRQVLRTAFGGLIAVVLGSMTTACNNPFNRGSGLSCSACEDIVGTVMDGGCEQLLAGRSVCGSLPEWRCKLVSVGICLASKLLDARFMDATAFCSSSAVDKIVGFLGGDRAPCSAPCAEDSEVCPTTGQCVPRCGMDRWLDTAQCVCVDEPTAIAGNGDESAPSTPTGKTGKEVSQRWRFVVPEGQVLVVGARWATVNGMPFGDEWVLAAYRDTTPIDMTIGFGFWAIVDGAIARSFFCGQLAPPTHSPEPVLMQFHPDRVLGLDDWGPTYCHDGIPSFPTMGNHYESPLFRYQLVWDDTWDLTMNNSWSVGGPDGGFDQIQLTNWTSIVAITGTGRWGGDGATCLEGVRQGIVGWTGTSSDVFVTEDFPAAPLDKVPGSEAAAVFQYGYTPPYGSPEIRIVYVDCITLPSGTENLVVLFDAPIYQYEEQWRTARDTLLAGLVVVG